MRIIVLIAGLIFLIAGCGNKGPLYLPTSKPQAQKPVPPPAPEAQQRPTPSEAVPASK